MHCQAGISRSPAFAMAYCMWQGPMSLTDAFALIREHRCVASPNLNFMGQLLLFGRCLCPSSSPLELSSPSNTTTPRQASLLATICLRKSPHASPSSGSPSSTPSTSTATPATSRDVTIAPAHHLVSAN